MAIEIKMPALSPTMEEGTLAKWLVKEGDEVKSGDIMAEIETDKATMEFEAVDEGTVGKILVAEGSDNVKVGTVIMTLAGEGADDAGSGDGADAGRCSRGRPACGRPAGGQPACGQGASRSRKRHAASGGDRRQADVRGSQARRRG